MEMKRMIFAAVGIVVLVAMVGMMGGFILELQGQYANLSDQYDNLSADYKNLSDRYDNLSADYKNLSDQYNNLSAQYEELNSSIERRVLEGFLKLDKTSENEYIDPLYVCVDFTNDLVENLRTAGFDARDLMLRTPGVVGHAMVFVYLSKNEGAVIIEPQTDGTWGKGEGEGAVEFIEGLLGYWPEIVKISRPDGSWD